MHDKNGGLAFNDKVLKQCEELYNNGCRVNHLLACIIDICQDRYKIELNNPESLFHVDKALEVSKKKKRKLNFTSSEIFLFLIFCIVYCFSCAKSCRINMIKYGEDIGIMCLSSYRRN